MELLKRILELVEANLLNCFPAMICTLLLIQLFFKDKFQIKKSYEVIKWVLLTYTVVNLIYFLLLLIVTPEESAFLNRATGKYMFAYWFLLFSSIILPFSLVYKKIGTQPFYLLFVSIMMKIGWYFELFVIVIASHHSTQFYTETEADWLSSPWIAFYITWLQGFILAWLVLFSATFIKLKKGDKK
jgi:hypothetical protein